MPALATVIGPFLRMRELPPMAMDVLRLVEREGKAANIRVEFASPSQGDYTYEFDIRFNPHATRSGKDCTWTGVWTYKNDLAQFVGVLADYLSLRAHPSDFVKDVRVH